MIDRLAICVDGYPPEEQFEPTSLPEGIDPTRATSDELAFAWRKQWQAGQEIRIRFLDGDQQLHDRVEGHARKWLDHANLVFTFGNIPDAEIRITFFGDSYVSMVGTDAMLLADDEPTMRLGGFTADMDGETMKATALHEFGHAIGCVHEQASPAANIPWDEQKVYEYYRQWQDWDDDKIYRNVLFRYAVADVRFTDHDPGSIMQYPVPPELTRDGFEIGWNNDLSELDKAFIGRMYP